MTPGAARRAVVFHWPTLLVSAACGGLALSNWVEIAASTAGAVALGALVCALVLGARARLLALALALVASGAWWGGLRGEALERSVLAAEIGASGRAEVVTTAAARRTEWSTRVLAQTRSFGGRRVRERVLLVLPASRSPPPRGAVLEASVRVREPRSADDGFDERAWLARQGVHVVLRADAWTEIGRRGGIAGIGDLVRDRLTRAVGRGTGGVRRAIVLGVVLGEDEGLPRRVQDEFRASGLYHLLAVSGQNVAFLAAGMYGLGWLLGLSVVVRHLLILAAIAGYLLAVGWQPSVVRAGVAGALASLAWLAARPRDRWHFLALGALALLAWMPTTLFEPGFQLSFAAVAAIFVGVPHARRLADTFPVPPTLADALAVAFACGLVTAPIVLVHFGQAPVYTVPANTLAFVAAPLVLGLGLAAAAVDPLSPEAAAGLGWLAGWAAAWLELVARGFAALPGAQIDARTAIVGALALSGLVLGTRVLGVRVPRRGTLPAVAALGGALVVAVGWWATRPAPAWTAPTGLRITFLDVGQGDSVLLETSSARVLVDQGPPEGDVAGQLLHMGVRTLTALVLTHPQRDHVGGAPEVIRRLRVGRVLDPGLVATGPEREEAVAAARERGVPVEVVRSGTSLRAGGLVLRVLWPENAGTTTEDPNLNAVVLLASYGEIDVLLPADAESDVTGRLPLGAVEVLKVAHHGSADPGLDDELDDLRPAVAVISCGRGNEYGHPRPETLHALAEVPELLVYRTDLDGRVVVEADGRRLRSRAEG